MRGVVAERSAGARRKSFFQTGRIFFFEKRSKKRLLL
jgi:hypothetical protein